MQHVATFAKEVFAANFDRCIATTVHHKVRVLTDQAGGINPFPQVLIGGGLTPR